MVHAAMRTVQLGAVDVMQMNVVASSDTGVSASTELLNDVPLLEGDISVCMDGFDFVRKLRVLGEVIDKEAFESSDERGWLVLT